jgi:hypothetical protein
VKSLLMTVGMLGACGLLAAGCGSGKEAAPPPQTQAAAAKPSCAHRAGWQSLANRIGADVYCPGWLPDPLTSQIGGQWNNINAVDKDRSYLIGFVWQETEVGINGAGGELHVNLRGYPGKTAIPTCLEGPFDKTKMPCFAEPHGTVSENGIKATLYTVNQDADQWHLLLAWRHAGGLYTVSEHLAPPLDYRKVIVYLKHELGSLVLVAPTHST